MSDLLQDLRYAWRSLAKSPGFALAAILTLAAGIGANTAIFSVVRGVLLRPLPYAQPERLLTVWENQEQRGGPRQEWTGQSVFTDWRRENRVFTALAAINGWQPELSGAGEPESLPAALVSPDLFRVLGVEPALGRGFRPEEETPGKDRVVILSHGLWQRRFGGDPSLIGKPIQLNGTSYTVLGVLPAGLVIPIATDAELLAPLDIDPTQSDYGNFYLRVIGRLRDGVDRQTAQADVDRVAALLAEQHPQSLGRVGVTLTSLKETVVGQTRPLLLALLAAVVLVLLIACANIANLLLARAAGRQREIALRGTLGAGHGRLARQLLTESLLLAVMGGTAGILLGGWGLDVLRWLAPAGTPRLEEVRLDGGVLLFGLVASLMTGVLFGLAPALGLSRPRLAAALQEGNRSGMAPGRSRLRSTLVVTELALGLALLIAAGLLIRSLGALSHVDPGFRADHVAVGQVAFPASRFPDPGQAFAVFDQFIERLGAQPQARAVGAVTVLPLSGNQLDLSIGIEGRLPPPGEEQAADFRAATPGYFRTMEIPLKAGRLPDGGDSTQAPKVVVVSERFVERFFPGEDPLGKRLRIGNVQNPEAPWWTVVGVVGGVRDNQLDKVPDPEVYAPFAQRPSRSVNLVMRYEGATDSALRALRETVAAVDPSRPVARLGTMDELVARSLAPARFVTFLLAAFAGLALLLAAVGIYGVVAYSVGQRSREIGIRLAIGAERVSILGMVLRWGLRLLVPGLLLGLAAAFFLVRLLASLLYGVQPADPTTFASVSALLALVTLAACYLPARRAAHLDPVRTLKAE